MVRAIFAGSPEPRSGFFIPDPHLGVKCTGSRIRNTAFLKILKIEYFLKNPVTVMLTVTS